ncbi:MAG: electron transfer flavoprotein subunit beta/FixA family protein [Bacteroidales bacterium]|nr:electron transfer flavoprotein subunit beta/FixA family protein [Lentimicrobiaceae bacterium]MDD5695072.1 electron transfer flavoprotein subunit beta/FixA family protein [Bacteroidales bacterium]
MKILICMSNVPDTTTKVRFKDGNTAFDTTGVQWIINPWDELALTRALQLKEEPGSGIEKVTVITVGLADAEPTIRKALAIGADDAIRVNSQATDAHDVARQIAEAVRNEGYDLILCGIESSDYNNSMVGGMVSEFLDIPSVSSVSSITVENGHFKIKREIDGGKETLSVTAPFVAIVQKGIAFEPRIPSMRGIMMARTKPLKVVEPVLSEVLVEHIRYELPPAKAKCRMVAEDNVRELVQLLHTEAKVI